MSLGKKDFAGETPLELTRSEKGRCLWHKYSEALKENRVKLHAH